MALSGQRIVIIGGSSGMGLATARAAVAAGAVVTIASSDEGRLEAALAELPDTCDGAVTNTRNEADIAALFARVGELDHLVYTAGDAVRPQPLADLPLDAARELLEVRFWGAIAAVKHAARHIRPGGSIVLTSGTVAVRPAPGTALASGGRGRHRRPDARAGRRTRPASRQRGPGGSSSHTAVGPGSGAAACGAVRDPRRSDTHQNGRRTGPDRRGAPVPDGEPLRHRNRAHH